MEEHGIYSEPNATWLGFLICVASAGLTMIGLAWMVAG